MKYAHTWIKKQFASTVDFPKLFPRKREAPLSKPVVLEVSDEFEIGSPPENDLLAFSNVGGEIPFGERNGDM